MSVKNCSNKKNIFTVFRYSALYITGTFLFLLVAIFITSHGASANTYTFKEEPISFQSGNGELRETIEGTLLIPKDPGPHPAVVMVHGSGRAKREKIRKEAEIFARSGIVTLIYDKRTKGYGLLDLSYSLLAKDVLAAVKTLHARSDVDPKKIGVWAFSEGGWVAPIAASRSKQISFVILVGPAGIQPIQQQAWYLENSFEHRGITSQSMIESIIHNGAGFMIASGLFPEARYNTVPSLKNLSQPLLVIWGDKDVKSPPLQSSRLIKKAVTQGGNHQYTFIFLSNADHAAHKYEENGFKRLNMFAPGYEKVMLSWLGKVIRGTPPTKKVIGDVPEQAHNPLEEVSDIHWYDAGWLHLGLFIFHLIAFGGYYFFSFFMKKTAVLHRWYIRILPITGLITVLGFWSFFFYNWADDETVYTIIGGVPFIWLLIQLFAVITALCVITLGLRYYSYQTKITGIESGRLVLLLVGGTSFIPWAIYWKLFAFF